MLEVKHLTKSYGQKLVVEDISFTVEKGEILGFLGPNGAGKSTTMNMLSGYLASTSGEILIDGIDLLENPQKAKAKIGYLPEKPPLYTDMTVKEYLSFIYDLKKISLNKKEHILQICKTVSIDGVYERMIKNLSKGYCQRVGLAQALLGDPEIIILDEPTVGLDPKQIVEIRDVIANIGKSKTVILSSHILTEIQAVCNKIIVINNGRLIADGTSEQLISSLNSSFFLSVSIVGENAEVTALLNSLKGVQTVSLVQENPNGEYEYSIKTIKGIDIRKDLFFSLAQAGFYITDLHFSASLEGTFLSLIENLGNNSI